MINDKELKKMGRRELVDIIYQLKKNEQKLQDDIALLQDALQEKRLRFSQVGSVAEAAASITELFSAAQKTADLFLLEISCMKKETEEECAAKIEETKNTVEQLISDSEKHLDDLKQSYQSEYFRLQQLREEIRKLEVNYPKMNEDKRTPTGRFRLFKR